MTTFAAETVAATPAGAIDPVCAAYAEAVARFLTSGAAADRAQVTQLAREMAAQWTPLRGVIQLVWLTAKPFLQPETCSNITAGLNEVIRIQEELCQAYEQATDLERRAHTRLASAYAQKIREIDTLLNSLPAYVITKDAQFRYVAVNRPFCEALGMTQEEIITHADRKLFPPETAALLLEQDQKVIDSESAVRRELTLRFHGQDRTVVIIKAPVFSPKGKVNGLIGVGFDITERKRLERELTLLAAAVESAAEAVFITDTDGSIQYANPAFGMVTGYSPQEAIGRNPRILKSDRQDAEFYQQMWATLSRGEMWTGAFTNKKKDGALYEVEQTIAPIRDSLGNITSYVAVGRDVTERNSMIQAMERAVMVKSEFTSMVSHELRTPLTAIKEAIDIVEDQTAGPINENQAGFMQLAKRNVDRLHRLINDTLDFSKLERGEFRLQLGRHDLNALTREIVMQQQLAAQKQGLQLEMSAHESLGGVRMDPDRVSQVLVNLIGNAIRYCERGWIEVSTERRKNEAVVKIQDTGPGIPRQDLEHIFEAFVQLSTGPGRRVGGTGLGLAISKQIVELHGGRIWVESEVGRGSAFYFALPLRANPARSEDATKECQRGENEDPGGR
jgi:PAS domain S-box-containing protein